MLKLDRVSKFYSTNGVVTAGFSKVSLDFELGEFVAITGESGSGKSTLLNVISGLDSYEEGEMYIFGQPTSGYSSSDMEEYRKRYIGNIFQTFNLINHYTVYQNVEMVLLLAGYGEAEIKERVDDIIHKVGLDEYRDTKASKLSGGQKQRVAIARALAKETPIIVADEPTGNLDVASAADIIKLLASLSKDKLIIIVTHNYEQVEPYVTRKISMHDGRIAEDKSVSAATKTSGGDKLATKTSEGDENTLQITAEPAAPTVKTARHDGLSSKNTVRLGARNAFSLPAKFLLLLFVFIFLTTGTFASYSAYVGMEKNLSGNAYGFVFTDVSPSRLLITKQNGTKFVESDYEKIQSVEHVSHLEKNDYLMDSSFDITDTPQSQMGTDEYGGYEINYWMTSFLTSMESLGDRELIKGRLPEAPDEALILIEKGGYIEEYKLEEVMGDFMEDASYLQSSRGVPADDVEVPIKIVGCAYFTEEEMNSFWSRHVYFECVLVMTDEGLDRAEALSLVGASSIEVQVGDQILTIGEGPWFDVWLIADESILPGTVAVPDYVQMTLDEYNARQLAAEDAGDAENVYAAGNASASDILGNQYVTFKTQSKYFYRVEPFKIAEVIEGENRIFINPDDLWNLYRVSDKMQISAVMDSDYYAQETKEALEAQGFKVIYLNETADKQSAIEKAILGAMRIVVLVFLLGILFFIIYFITKLIMKSQNVYYSTIRMLGGSERACSGTLLAELLVVFHIAFAICVSLMLKVRILGSSILPEYMVRLVRYVNSGDYIILYLVVLIMTLLLAYRYSRQMFKQTAMNAYREEV